MKPDGYPEADVVFDADEDNNPFSHVGIASLMGEVSSKAGEDVSAVANVGTDSSTEDNDHEHENDDDDNDEDDLLYNATVPSKDAFNAIPMHFESRVTDLLKPNSKVTIQITEAGNSNEGVVNSSKKYVVYTIKLINVNDRSEEILTRRRYSEFESLRLVLTKIFPLIIVPPIPPKNYVSFNVFNGLVGPNVQSNTSSSTNNLYINSTHLNSTKLIEHRKRLLANFLNNCLEIAQIRNLEFFSKFLDPNSNWVDEINLISSQLPKSIYLSNPENGLRTDAIYSHLPVPSGDTMSFLKDNRKKLTKKTNKLLSNGGANSNNNGNGTSNGITETVDTTSASSSIPSTFEGNKKYIVDTSNLDELNRKIMENYIGLSYDYTELGTIFNSFSLELADSSPPDPSKTETDETKLNVILDKIGQGFDRSYITINALIGDLETKFSEPLGEVVQYSTILHFISRYQSKKIKQKQLLDNDLKEKRIALDELVLAEQESGRVEGITNSRPLAKNDTYDFEGAAPGRSSKFKFPNINSIKKLTQYVADIIDQNPEQTRKQKLTNLEQKISVLEKCQGIMLEDISYIADELHKNFRVFHTKQLRMIYEILLCYNRFLIGWAKKNMDIWEEVKEEVQKS